MKKLIVIACAVSISSFIYAQRVAGDKVPEAVSKGFATKFPGVAKPNSWELENGKYECEFKQNGVEHEASFDKDGKWLDTETDIKIAGLPKEVSDAAAKQFAGYKVTSAEKVEASDGKNYFDVDLAKGADKWEARFTPKGELNSKWQEK